MRATDHEKFMKKALEQARQALDRNEFPVGCVIVRGGRVIAGGARSGTAAGGANEIDHAEIMALRAMFNAHPPSELRGLTLYATMEPCLMCFAAAVISGVDAVVYAYEDAMGGGTSCDLRRLGPLYRRADVAVIPHVLRGESLALFQAFFSDPQNAYLKGTLLAEYTLKQSAA